ncbi:FAD/NAD(P)-binding domain-containing protein [Sarocladium strictum]
MDKVQDTPSERQRLRCTIIGAGFSGILIAYKLRKHLGDYVEFRILEKSPELGGTWFENRYPGCACDVPSHSYQYSFCPNPHWSSFYASSSEILAYLKGVASFYDLERYIQYNSRVKSARWSEAKSTWTVEVEGGSTVESEILINGSGILNDAQMPAIDGLSSFVGPLLHTATWDSTVDLTDKRIGVIGAGASAIQMLPKIQPIAKSIQVYIRTPSWISPPVGLTEGIAAGHTYSTEEKDAFTWNQDAYLQMRKTIEGQFNGAFPMFMKDSAEQKEIRSQLETRMKALIKDEELQKNLIPSFEAGCRRISPGDAWLASLQQPNVTPVFDPITRATKRGILVGDKLYEADILIAATGFNTSFTPRFPIIGLEGANLQDLWRTEATSYMGTGVSGFPNYMTFLGPNTPIANGSVMGSLEGTADYFIRILRKVIREDVKSFDVRPEAQADFNTHTQDAMNDLVWSGSCRSWYKSGPNGKVTAVWPGSSLHYLQVLSEGRWEDYSWKYKSNRYDYWGRGLSWIEKPELDPLGLKEREWFKTANTVARPDSDISYYLWKAPPLPEKYLVKPDPPASVEKPKVNGDQKVEHKPAPNGLDDTALLSKISDKTYMYIEATQEITVPV